MKLYFYKKFNGEIFPCEAKEAFMIHTKYEQVGVSDGTLFFDKINQARAENQELLETIAEYNSEIEKTEDVEERMILKRKLKPLQKQWAEIFKKANEDGVAAELEAARGHHEVPVDNSRVEFVGNEANLQEKQWTGKITKS